MAKSTKSTKRSAERDKADRRAALLKASAAGFDRLAKTERAISSSATLRPPEIRPSNFDEKAGQAPKGAREVEIVDPPERRGPQRERDRLRLKQAKIMGE